MRRRRPLSAGTRGRQTNVLRHHAPCAPRGLAPRDALHGTSWGAFPLALLAAAAASSSRQAGRLAASVGGLRALSSASATSASLADTSSSTPTWSTLPFQ